MTSDSEQNGTPAPSQNEEQEREHLLAERDRLTALRDGVRSELSGQPENASVSELSDADQHPADTATETVAREEDVSLLDALNSELDDVEAALARLEDGTYGICQACGRPISPERLEALPATRFCIDDAELASAEAAPGVVPLGPSSAKPLEDSGGAI